MNEERRKIIQSLIYPSLFVTVLWLVKLFEITFNIDLSQFGLQPLHFTGLLGILTSPLLHEGFSHLFANSVSLFCLSALMFYFYREIAWRIHLLIYLMTGAWVWFFARGDSIHIGASGVVYGLAAFLFLSGILRRESKLMAITLLTTFLYGSMVWGIFPQFFPLQHISWESHLMGLLSGSILAIYYRKTGPQRKKYEWEDEDDDNDSRQEEEVTEEIDPNNKPPENQNTNSTGQNGSPDILYHYKPSEQ